LEKKWYISLFKYLKSTSGLDQYLWFLRILSLRTAVIIAEETPCPVTSAIKEEIKEQLTKLEQKNLILDLSGVPLLDSSGLGILISLFKYINQQQGKIVYVGATDYVKKIIGFAKLEQIFTLAPDLEQAKQIIYNK